MKNKTLTIASTDNTRSNDLSEFFLKKATLDRVRKEKEDLNMKQAIERVTGGKNIVVSNCNNA